MKDFYTFDDLNDRSILDHESEHPARFAIIGYPVAQSKSPQMQQAALDAANKDVRYIRLNIKPEEFGETLSRLTSLGFIGANVTVPHKQAAAMACDNKDQLATLTGAVNTIVFPSESSELKGFNTDGPGFAKAIREDFGVDLKDLKVVILGACGGAGTAVAHTCALNRCEKLTLVNRPNPKLEPLKQSLTPIFIDERRLEGTSDRLRTYAFDSPRLEEAINDADLIVNATSLGLKPTDPSPIPASMIQPYHLVYDLLTHNTAFQEIAREQGARTSDGLSMLVYQGAIAYTCWFGETPNVKLMKKALGL